jgi:hypothetical protein
MYQFLNGTNNINLILKEIIYLKLQFMIKTNYQMILLVRDILISIDTLQINSQEIVYLLIYRNYKNS